MHREHERRRRNLLLLTLSELCFMSGLGLILPIMAVFYTSSIAGGSVLTAGIAAAVYQLTMSVGRIPISRYCDRKGLHMRFMTLGYSMMALAPLGYIISSSMYQIYAVQAVLGLGAAIGRSGWYHVVHQNVPSGGAGHSWNSMRGIIGMGDALSAAVGGLLATALGFELTFVVVVAISVASVAILSKVSG